MACLCNRKRRRACDGSSPSGLNGPVEPLPARFRGVLVASDRAGHKAVLAAGRHFTASVKLLDLFVPGPRPEPPTVANVIYGYKFRNCSKVSSCATGRTDREPVRVAPLQPKARAPLQCTQCNKDTSATQKPTHGNGCSTSAKASKLRQGRLSSA
eukprot:scaffold3102_cov123-Isochrysis_galbana.AAC.3